MNMLISCMKILNEMLIKVHSRHDWVSLFHRQRTVESLVDPWSAAAAK